MILAETQGKVIISDSDMSTQFLDVKYVSAKREMLVRQQIVSGGNTHTVLAGKSIPLTYIKGDPVQIRFNDYDPASPWGWLVVGIAALCAVLLGKKMLHEESGNRPDSQR